MYGRTYPYQAKTQHYKTIMSTAESGTTKLQGHELARTVLLDPKDDTNNTRYSREFIQGLLFGATVTASVLLSIVFLPAGAIAIPTTVAVLAALFTTPLRFFSNENELAVLTEMKNVGKQDSQPVVQGFLQTVNLINDNIHPHGRKIVFMAGLLLSIGSAIAIAGLGMAGCGIGLWLPLVACGLGFAVLRGLHAINANRLLNKQKREFEQELAVLPEQEARPLLTAAAH